MGTTPSRASRARRHRGRLGDLVGYQTRYDRQVSDRTRIRFLTEGLFLRRLQGDPDLRGVGAVLLDEFHERSVAADLSLGLVRQLQETCRPELRLVPMSATLDAALAADCIQLSVEGDTVAARRPVYAGKATAEVEFTDDSLKVITVRPRSAKASEPDTARSAEVAQATVELPEQKTALKEIIAGGGERPDVTEAAIIVTGGRSLGSAENFSIIENFADSIGAAVGSSRAAVDAGYRPYRDQVGQTGKVVSPQVYIACGVSGAIQHLAGMRTSKHIVAINTDPEAPIFQVADHGIVGDLFEVVPLLAEAAKNRNGN